MKKSVRLTNHLRDKLIRKALDDKFGAKMEELNTKISKVVETLFVDQFREHLEIMGTLPDGYFPDKDGTHLTIGGRRYGYIEFTRGIITPLMYRRTLEVESNRGLEKWLLDLEAIKRGYKALNQQLDSLLFNVKSSKALYDLWPESRGILDLEVVEPDKELQFPCVLIKSLNDALGLPE